MGTLIAVRINRLSDHTALKTQTAPHSTCVTASNLITLHQASRKIKVINSNRPIRCPLASQIGITKCVSTLQKIDTVPCKGLSFGVWNARSLNNKVSSCCDLIQACTLNMKKPHLPPKSITGRNLKSIDIHQLCQDIERSPLITKPPTDKQFLCEHYNTIMSSLLDKHAPEKTCTVVNRPFAPWYNDAIRLGKQKLRQSECCWQKTKLAVHHQIMKASFKYYADVQSAKSDFYTRKIDECDQKQLFREVAQILSGPKKLSLPSHDSGPRLVHEFDEFFSTKIAAIRSNMDDETLAPLSTQEVHCPTTFTSFNTVSDEDVHKIVTKAPTKSSGLDRIPTTLLKRCICPLLPVLKEIINTSISSGVVPACFKSASITPLLKKTSLNQEEMKNYRPVSQLPYVSKLLERIVAPQLHSYLEMNNFFEPMQSAYRKNFSVETALLKVHNDILVTLDNGGEALLILLDLSSAFDTIDHSLIIARLQFRYGIASTALDWFSSYLDQRHQCVTANGCSSKKNSSSMESLKGPSWGHSCSRCTQHL